MNEIGAESSDWDRHFKLMADIDLAQYTRKQFNIIGYNRGFRDSKPFRGVFDGNNKAISNFTYISADTDNNGISQHIDEGDFGIFGHVIWAHIKDLRIKDPNIILENGRHVGVLAGSFHNGTITRCSVEGGRIYAKQYVGGLIGQNSGTITECSSTTTVSADSESGGLVGTNSGDISFSYTTSSVEGGGWIGGFVGRNHGTISQCHSHSIVTGMGGIGGLVGYSERGQIDLCYSLGSVSGQRTIGGLCGKNGANISSCFSAADVPGTDESTGGLIGYNHGSVIACKATGNVKGVTFVSGLVAQNIGKITHCYANGSAQGNSFVAGLGSGQILYSYSTGLVSGSENVSGFAIGGSTYLCYWDTETSQISESAAGKGKTTAQMQSASTYRGWGYGGHWVIDGGNDYPRLIWEDTLGELLADPPRSYSGGVGEPNNPYKIHTAQQFVSIAYYLEDFDKSFILTNNIDLATISPDEIIPIGTNGRPIGQRVTIGFAFEGSFFGDSHTIFNFTCHEDGQDFMGLFGSIGRNGHVDNVRIENISVSGNHYTGGLAGHNLGMIQRCAVAGTVEGSEQVGGLVGSNGGSIVECSTSGQVAGYEDVGGIVGYNSKDISVSYSKSSVKGNNNVGGIVGKNGRPLVWTIHPAPPPGFVPLPADCSVSSCYFTGFVEGQGHVGGLVGENGGLVRRCYSAASVTDIGPPSDDQTSVGGLVGINDYGVVLLSYWDAESSGQFYSGGGKNKTTEQMMTTDTFRGWGYLGEWVIDHGNDYPHLAWEGLGGELIVDDPNRYAGGTGQPDDPYQIHSAEEFINIGYYLGDWDRCFVFTNDIDLKEVGSGDILPIGALGTPFTGSFDGNGHIVSNFRCLSDTENYCGVFGSIGPAIPHSSYNATPHDPNDSGYIINLNLENVQVSAYCCAGGLAGYNSGIISNCSVTGNVTAVLKDAGGLLGYNVGKITDCTAKCSVTSQRVAGGLLGHNEGPVTACSFSGSVEAEGTNYRWCAGGLIGDNYDIVESCHFNGAVTGGYNTGGLIGFNEGTVIDSSASGNVTGTWNVGGLVGTNKYRDPIIRSFSNSFVTGENKVGGLVGDNAGEISNCYAKGSVGGIEYVAGLTWSSRESIISCYSSCLVTGQQKIAGLVGSNDRSDVSSSFWDVETSGQIMSAGGTGKITAEMQTASTFLDVGWDFVDETENGTEDIWWINEGQDYPRL
ncbi:MAG: GLUG motif-containing protein, partial [Planctomycetota bacterium]